jgi:hypothetical protein
MEGTMEANSRDKKWKDIGPSNVGIWVRSGGRVEEGRVTKFDVVGGSSSEAMPAEKPPAARRVRERSVIGMMAEEMKAAGTIRSTSRRSEKRLGQVNLDNEAPLGSKNAGRVIGDKEEMVGGSSDCVKQRGTSNWGKWNRRIIRGANRDSSSCRNQSNRNGKGRRGRGGVGVINIAKVEQRRVISKQRRWKPRVVAHLNVKGFLKRVWEQSMRVIEAAEIGGVIGGARKNTWRKRRQSLNGVLEHRSSGMAVTADKIGTITSGADNFIRSTFVT